jgi:ATP adenylyltransferase
MECIFCERLLQGSSDTAWDTTIAETDQYIIVPTKGSLVAGWLLVVSKQHFLCSGELQEKEFVSLERAVYLAKEIVEGHFGAATVFEHGPQVPGTSLGCGIDHLHLHVVALNFSLVEAVNSSIQGVTWQGLPNLRSLGPLYRSGIGYAVVGEPHAQLVWFPPPHNVRQPLRRAIANHLGVPERFDYAKHPYTENVLRTLDRVMVGA